MSEWQPIETAPKDKDAHIIVISHEGNVYGVYRDGKGWFARNVGRWMPEEDLAGWMPLPAPPGAKEQP